MTNRTFAILLASTAVIGTSMVGCSGVGIERLPLVSAGQGSDRAARIERLLDEKDYARALLAAEDLVGAQPEDGAARALLGRAYLANGRYLSARTAFTDAMTLGNRDPRTIVSLSLSQTGLGNPAAAHELLATHVEDLPVADYGLAMAMTGDPQEAVRALLQAVKLPDATARTRQNLAYALAMGGAWAQARLVAGQDLSAREAEQRIGQWAASFLAGKEQDRVVAMIGIAPRADDEGVPTPLALNQPKPPVDMAGTPSLMEEARAEVAAEQAPLGELTEQPVEQAASDVPLAPTAVIADVVAPPPPAVPVATSKSDPLRAVMQAAFGQRTVTSAKIATRTGGIAAPATDAAASDWVIQLGAYDSGAIAREKWQRITARRVELARFRPVNSQVATAGRTFYRLAIRGFVDRAGADATCVTLKARGQNCFVRLDDTDTTRIARAEARKAGQQLAGKAAPKARTSTLASR